MSYLSFFSCCIRFFIVLGYYFMSLPLLQAATFIVDSNGDLNTSTTLRQALLQVQSGDTIEFSPNIGTIFLTKGPLPAITQQILTIAADPHFPVTIDGNGKYQIFSVAQPGVNTGSLILRNITLTNGLSQGGSGGSGQGGGGGGAAGGGGLYLHTGSNVTLESVWLNGNQAIGGMGGSLGEGYGGGGGGGYGSNLANHSGNGGSGLGSTAPGGGGGGNCAGGNAVVNGEGNTGGLPYVIGGGGAGGAANASVKGGGCGGAAFTSPSTRHLGGSSANLSGGGGGGGLGDPGSKGPGQGGVGIGPDGYFGGGGGGAAFSAFVSGGDGYGTGGGGGACMANGGSGGVAGGGGGGGNNSGNGIDGTGININAVGGNGGFGGGGGGGVAAGGTSLFGGGRGSYDGKTSSGGGGGGAAMGGNIFLQDQAQLMIGDNVIIEKGQVIEGKGGKGGIVPAETGSAFGRDIFIRSGATLVFTNSRPITIATDITSNHGEGGQIGQGGLVMNGTGKVTLTGTNSYTGPTTVNSGTLVVNGSIGSASDPVSIRASGVLRGIGTINGLITVNSGGKLRPGTSIGTQNYAAGLTLNSESTLTIEINAAGQTSLANVTGTATLHRGAQLEIIANPGAYSVMTYPPLLMATSINGSFSSSILGISPENLAYQLFYTPTTIQLQLTASTTPQEQLISPMIAQQQLIALFLPSAISGQSGNNAIVADYLNSLPVGMLGAQYDILLDLPHNEQTVALSTINPARNAFLLFNSYNTAFTFSNLLCANALYPRYLENMGRSFSEISLQEFFSGTQLLAQNQDSFIGREGLSQDSQAHAIDRKPYSIWLTGFGDLASQSAKNQNPAFHMTNGGFLLGMERYYRDSSSNIFDNALIGGALGYVFSSITEEDHFGSGHTNGIYSSLYTTIDFNNHCYCDIAVWGNYQALSNSRNIFYPGYSAKAESQSHVWGGDLHGSFGYDYLFQTQGILEPFISLDWAFDEEFAYVEHGAGVYNMYFPSQFSSMLRTEGGAHLFYTWLPCWGLWFLHTKLSYVNKVPFGAVVTAGIVGAPGAFTVTALNATQNLCSVAGEIAVRSKKGYYTSLIYNGEFGSGYIYNQLSCKIGYEW
jgi:hypothetical protein